MKGIISCFFALTDVTLKRIDINGRGDERDVGNSNAIDCDNVIALSQTMKGDCIVKCCTYTLVMGASIVIA
jgi:hypothetical protein